MCCTLWYLSNKKRTEYRLKLLSGIRFPQCFIQFIIIIWFIHISVNIIHIWTWPILNSYSPVSSIFLVRVIKWQRIFSDFIWITLRIFGLSLIICTFCLGKCDTHTPLDIRICKWNPVAVGSQTHNLSVKCQTSLNWQKNPSMGQ